MTSPQATEVVPRLADCLDDALRALDLPGSAQRSPWGVEYAGTVIATAVPPPPVARAWGAHPVIAASRVLHVTLAEAGVGAVLFGDSPIVGIPDPMLRPGATGTAVVRCDDLGPPQGDALALGAFLLCWALDVPGASLTVAHRSAAGAAAALGIPVRRLGAQPVVAVCSGSTPCPPPLVVDALAAGIPVAGLRTPSLVEVVGDAALLIDPEAGIEALAAAIAALLGDPQLALEVGRRGPARIAELDPPAGLRALARHLASTSGMVGMVGPAGA